MCLIEVPGKQCRWGIPIEFPLQLAQLAIIRWVYICVLLWKYFYLHDHPDLFLVFPDSPESDETPIALEQIEVDWEVRAVSSIGRADMLPH